MQFLKYSHLFINKKKSKTRKKNGRVFFAATKIAQASKKVNLVSQKFVPNKYSFRFISHQKEDELLGNVSKDSLKSNKKFVPNKYSFRFISHQKEDELLNAVTKQDVVITEKEKINDEKRRLFLKTASIVGAGVVGATLLPKKADALVMGGTPGSSVVGLKNSSNVRINPATEETLASLPAGKIIYKKTTSLTSSGTIHTPGSGKKIRLYSLRFSLTADMTDISYRFTSGGSDFEKYLAPRTGGLYGSNSHPNYVEGGINEALYCVITGSGSVQTIIIYDEV